MDYAPHAGHGHSHHGHPPAGRARELQPLFGALAITCLIMIVEGVGGYLSHSLGLLADAGHMLTDASALLLSIAAVWLSARPADVRRTFGYYRLEILAAAVNGMALFGVAGFIVYEAWQRFQVQQPINVWTMLITGGAGLVANLGGFALLSRSHVRSLNIRAAIVHLVGDMFSSLGVVAAAIAMSFTHLYLLDPLLSVAIALAIVYGAVRLLAEAVDILLEGVPGHLDLADILAHMQGASGVQAVHDLHLWTIGNGMYALSAHLVVQGHDACRNDDILTAVKTGLQKEFGIAHTTLQIESEVYRHVEEIH